MCYSAMVQMDLDLVARVDQCKIDLAAFEKLFEARLSMPNLNIAKALETNFNLPRTPEERRIRELIVTFQEQQTKKYQEGVIEQEARLADVQRRLAKKESKTARNEERIATEKISWNKHKLEDLTRIERKERDSRIYPKWYAPVVILEGNERVIRPMRYLMHPENLPDMVFDPDTRKLAPFDVAYNGCYNARRDNLERFWKKHFGYKQGYLWITSFFENVETHKFEHRELGEGEKSTNMVIQFNPRPAMEMRVACLWSHREREGMLPLESFAAVTDEPPAEVAAAGHDRILIPLNADSLEVWLRPDPANLAEQQEALDNRVRPYYEHKIAA